MERGRQSGGWFGFGNRDGGPADQSVLSEGDRDGGADLEDDDDMGDALNQLRYVTPFIPFPSPPAITSATTTVQRLLA